MMMGSHDKMAIDDQYAGLTGDGRGGEGRRESQIWKRGFFCVCERIGVNAGKKERKKKESRCR